MKRPRSIPLICTLLGLAGGTACGLSGCARSTLQGGINTAYAADDLAGSVAFWHRLPERSAVTNDEGLHGLLCMIHGEDDSADYPARVARAKKEGLILQSFDQPGNATMSKGTLAAALARIIGIKGGVLMQLSGLSPRYATRELTYLGILPEGSTENQSISGLDYIGVISKAQDFAALQSARSLPLQSDR